MPRWLGDNFEKTPKSIALRLPFRLETQSGKAPFAICTLRNTFKPFKNGINPGAMTLAADWLPLPGIEAAAKAS